MKRIVQEYGISVNETDSDGTEWVNILLEEKDEGFKLNDVIYYLNDNSLPPENTFYFDQLQFLSTPVFIVASTNEWRPSHPDNTLLLSRISFSCPMGQRACGLRCCPETNYVVQKLFLDEARQTPNGKIPKDTSIQHGDIIYNTNDSNSTCSYTFSYHDNIVRRVLAEPEVTIYFSCPNENGCCGLSCSLPPKNDFSRLPISNSDAAVHFYFQNRHIILLSGCVVFLALFAVVTTLNYRQHRRKMMDEKAPMRISHETQTSMLSLEKEAFMDNI